MKKPLSRLRSAFYILLLFEALFCLLVVYCEHCFLPIRLPDPIYSLRKQYITIRYDKSRRIGNLLFNYASARGIAARNNLTLVLPDDFPLRRVFELQAVWKPSNEIPLLGPLHPYHEFGHRACAYDPLTERFHKSVWGVELIGYYQSWRYFNNIEPQLRQEFQFRDVVMRQAKNWLAKVSTRDDVFIGVHVRRGDMLQPHLQKYGYTVADSAFLKRAMTYQMLHVASEMRHKVHFIVCSDDISWCKKNIDSSQMKVTFSEGNDPYVDLALLSLCSRTVVTTGSFGWFGSWLANTSTVYYNNWPKPVSVLEYFTTKKDYFYPTWTPLD